MSVWLTALEKGYTYPADPLDSRWRPSADRKGFWPSNLNSPTCDFHLSEGTNVLDTKNADWIVEWFFFFNLPLRGKASQDG